MRWRPSALALLLLPQDAAPLLARLPALSVTRTPIRALRATVAAEVSLPFPAEDEQPDGASELPPGLEEGAIGGEELLDMDDNDNPAFSSNDYFKTQPQLADDGRALLRAPQRYSSRQWRTNLQSIVSCRILRAVRGQLLWQCAWALLVSIVYMAARGAAPTLPALPHSLLGGVMGVLLGFRTNQSYDRFWEGRKLWGNCFSGCRSIARCALVYLDADKETYDKVIRHLMAFPVALKQHLRGEIDIDEFRGTLDVQETNFLSTANNLPLSVCTSLSMATNAIKLDTTQSANNLLWWVLEDHISKLSQIVSDCERLVRTPVPRAYSLHTSRLLSLWVGTLPLVLVGCFSGYRRLLTVPLTAFVAWALFCTEELGHIIEEPFGAFGYEGDARNEVLPLDRYCASLQNDLSEVNRFKSRALRDLEDGQRNKEQEEEGTKTNSGFEGYGPKASENNNEVSDEEAIEIAWDAKQTVDAVEAEQEMEKEAAQEAVPEQRDEEQQQGLVEPVHHDRQGNPWPKAADGERMGTMTVGNSTGGA